MGNIYRFPGGEEAKHEIIEEIDWEGEDEEQPSQSRFRGTGMTLGGDDTPSQAIPDPHAAGPRPADKDPPARPRVTDRVSPRREIPALRAARAAPRVVIPRRAWSTTRARQSSSTPSVRHPGGGNPAGD